MPRDVSLNAQRVGDVWLARVEGARRFGVDAWVSERRGGVSRPPFDTLNLGDHVGDDPQLVRENRDRLARALGVGPGDLRVARQVHETNVVHARDVGATTRADALIGDEHHAVAVLVADCVPILLVHQRTRDFAVVHAGWRGLAAGILRASVNVLGAGSSTYAFVGPCVSPAVYQIGPEVARHFVDVPGALHDDVDDRSRLDLRAVAARQLRELGVDDDAIEQSVEVTDGGERYFSDRARRPCGRFALVAKRAS
ncbi:MAG: laccase domain-containing protein [Acidobacteriota bacterium]|nr:laccase domain-containing protein [Acidobacteriota bacterium]